MAVYKLKKINRPSIPPVEGYAIRCRIWIEKDGELYISKGRIMLLESIDKTGSISAAAKAMNLHYRNAWLWIEAMNRLAESPLVEKSTGGVGGGYAKLTDKGREVIARYRELDNEVEECIKRSV